jgi:hypothetical protein
VKKSRLGPASEGQPLWLPQGGHKGRPYNGVFSHIQSRGRKEHVWATRARLIPRCVSPDRRGSLSTTRVQ